MSPRSAAAVAVVLAVMPGWTIAGGLYASGALHGRSQYSSLPLLGAGFASVLMLRMATRLKASRGWADPVAGGVPWLSGLAQTLLISGGYLRDRAREAELPVRGVLAAVQLPWWGVLAFWVFLCAYAIVDLARHALGW